MTAVVNKIIFCFFFGKKYIPIDYYCVCNNLIFMVKKDKHYRFSNEADANDYANSLFKTLTI